MLYQVGDVVAAYDGVTKLDEATITEVGVHNCYWVGEHIFTGKELTLIRTARRSAQKTTEEIIKNMTEQSK